MKNLATSLFIFVLVYYQPIYAGDFGLGILLGDPTGVSANLILADEGSLDFALAYDQGAHENLHLHATYLIRYPKSIALDGEALGWYWGIGARMLTIDHDHDHNGIPGHRHNDYDHDDKLALGPRVPIGLNYELRKQPIEFFVELAIILNIIPNTKSDINAGIGGRYYF